MRKMIKNNQKLGLNLSEKSYDDYGFVWTIEDVARELKVSVRHLYKLVSEDRIPYAKVGRLVRFSFESGSG
jgi:excisionase family DNA binding protein